MIDQAVGRLVAYGLERGLLEPEDTIYAVNALLEALRLDSWDGSGLEGPAGELAPVLKELTDFGAARGLLDGDSVTYRDLFDTGLMGRITPRPSEVIRRFRKLYRESPEKATDWYYRFSQDTNYIRRDRIKKDLKWKAETPYGQMDITINLSKPEAGRLSQMPALHGERGLRRAARPPRQAESQGDPGGNRRKALGTPVFALRLLQRALHRVQ